MRLEFLRGITLITNKMKKQSSIEWLVEQLHNGKELSTVIRKAEEMHEQEIKDAHCDWNRIVDKLPSRSADEYYKNTYEKEN